MRFGVKAPAGCEVGDEAFGSFPPAGVLELLEVPEVVSAVTESHVIAVAGQRDVGGVFVEVGSGEDEGVINGRVPPIESPTSRLNS